MSVELNQQLLLLRKREIEAENQGDLKLLARLKKQRLKLELKEIEEVEAQLNGTKNSIFKPKKHNEIIPVKMEIIGLDYIPLVKNAYNVLAGRGGSGKSAVALKSMLIWLRDNPSKNALAFFTEDTIEEVTKRTNIIVNKYNLEKNLLDRIFFITLDEDDRIKWITKNRDDYEINELYLNEMTNFCKENSVEFIILDPMKRFHRLAENSNDDMDVLARDCFSRIAVDTNSTVLVLHHGSKSEGGSRGAGTITDSSRLSYSISKYYLKDENGKQKENEKMKGKIRLEFIKDNLGVESKFDLRGEMNSIENPLFNGIDIPVVSEYDTSYDVEIPDIF